MRKLFYDYAKVLDPCKTAESPASEQIELVLSMIADEKFARYFFDQLENPVWAPILEERGYFLHPPEPVEEKPGSFRIPNWPAVLYLTKVAKSSPNTVLSVVKNIKTENSRVQEQLLDALIEIPPEKAIQSIEQIGQWLPSKFTDFIPVKYGVLIEKWLSAGYMNEATNLFETLIAPVLINQADTSKNPLHRAPLRFKSDPYWINEVIQKQYPILINTNCKGVVEVYDRQLRRSIELAQKVFGAQAESYVGFDWRLDIPFRSSDYGHPEVIDVLVDGLRDAIGELCKQSVDDGRHFLSSYLANNSIIFQRLALFTLRRFGKQYADLLDEAVSNRIYMESKYFAAEYKGLLRDQFDTLSQELKEKIIGWILEGPRDIDERTKRRAEWNPEEGKIDVLDEWVLLHLSLIKDYLSGDALITLQGLVSKRGAIDTMEKPKLSMTSPWSGIPSPVSVEELTKMSFDDLHNLILTYEPPDNSFRNTKENLAETFGSVVQNDPGKYQEFAPKLASSGIHYVYISSFLSVMRENIRKGDGKLTEPIINLCETLVSNNKDMVTVQLEVARVLEETLNSTDSSLSWDLLHRIRSLLIELSNNPDPIAREDKESNFDSFTESLNCVRGLAMHGILRYSLYVHRKRKAIEKKETYRPYIDAEILAVLDEKLDKSKDPSLAVHSVFGAYFPQLHYLEEGWVKEKIDLIFPSSEELTEYWQAAWDAYVFSSNLFREPFSLLIPQYQRGLRLLNDARGKGVTAWQSSNERLAQHILFAYLNNLTDFGHKNELLDLFFANAPVSVRAGGVFWLSKVLEQNKTDETLWSKLWALWQTRIKIANISNDREKFGEEVSDYMRWLVNCPVDLGFLYSTIQQSIPFFQHGYDIQQMIAFAAKHSTKYPLEAVTLLINTIKTAKEIWWIPEEKDEETILRVALASQQDEAKQIALEIINYRGEIMGNFRWKSLIV